MKHGTILGVALVVCAINFSVPPPLRAQQPGGVSLRLSLADPPQPGRAASNIVLPWATADGTGPSTQPFDLSRELGRVVVLVFYSSTVAPRAIEAWRAIAGQQPALQRGEVELVGVSADSLAALAPFARSLHLKAKLLSDSGRSVSRQYGASRSPKSAPLIVVIDRGGTVRYVDQRFDPTRAASFTRLDTAIADARKGP